MRLSHALLALAVAFCLSFPLAHGASTDVGLSAANVDDYDYSSLQRGARLFMNYCIGCHGAHYARYGRVAEDLRIPEDELAAAFLSGQASINDYIVSSIGGNDAREWFNQAAPPDLTLVSRVRGADWVYSFLKGYYYDPSTLTGWNNTVYSNTAMPHVLHSLEGVRVPSEAEGTNGYIFLAPGTLDEAGYAAVARDITNFLAYMGDPGRHFRVRTGIYVVLFLLALVAFTHVLYREYWKDIK